MKAYIILSVADGLLQSKPFQCGMTYPPLWRVPITLPLELPRFMESANFILENDQSSLPILTFKKTDKFIYVQDQILACVYEMEIPIVK